MTVKELLKYFENMREVVVAYYDEEKNEIRGFSNWVTSYNKAIKLYYTILATFKEYNTNKNIFFSVEDIAIRDDKKRSCYFKIYDINK